MDINEPLVMRLSKVVIAIDNVIQQLKEDAKGLATASPGGFARLVAYDLMVRPEVLDYNPILTTGQGHIYVAQHPIPPAEKPVDAAKNKPGGFPIIRASPLQVVEVVLERYHDGAWRNPEVVAEMVRSIVAATKQRQCCWYNGQRQKACSAMAVALRTQANNTPYVFCGKHWSPTLREGVADGGTRIVPPSEQNLDDWLDCIV